MLKIRNLLLLCLIFALVGCTIPVGTPSLPTQDVAKTLDAVRTEAAYTVTAEIKQPETSTPLPPADTLAPSPTLEPTSAPTDTSLPPTEQPTNTSISPTATDTPVPPTATETPAPTKTTAPANTAVSNNPGITILGVEKNKAVTVQTKNFPPNQTFTIRMGPFTDFANKKIVVGTLKSGSGGTIKFTVNIPDELKDVPKITIRLDSEGGWYAYNAFTNENSGTVSYDVTATPVGKCEVVTTTNPSGKLNPKDNFDAIWTVKNISGSTWDKDAVDYKYMSGTQMQKYDKLYDLEKTVKNNEKITIIVDMIAPDKAGTYTTTWAIVQGSTVLCNLPITITVK